MFRKISQRINSFFDQEYFEPTPELKKPQVSNELKEKIENVLKESGMYEHAKNFEKVKLPQTLPPIFKIFSDLMNDEDYLAHNLRNLKELAEDESLLAKIKPYFSFALFEGFNGLFRSLMTTKPQYKSYFMEYLDFIEDKVNVSEISSSLAFINEEKQKFGKIAINKSIGELLELRDWIFFDKLKQSSEGQYRIYFNDWALKNSQIIEYTVKAIFTLLLQLNLANKGVNEDDIKELIKSNNTIGKLIHYFDLDASLINLRRLRIYRNAMFHPGTEFVYDVDANKRKLIFKDDYGKFEVSIDEFINDFKKVLIFIATFNYVVANELFKVENDGKNIFQVNYEYAKKNGMKKFLVWIVLQKARNRYYKYFLKK
jgi:hypothetical protein